MTPSPLLGVVVPTLNEGRELPSLLDDLAELSLPHRVLVVDGGSSDGTRKLARARGAEVEIAPRGRASQLNAGAARLDTPWLLFLHADVRLSADARTALQDWISGASPEDAAFFGLRFSGDHGFYRLAERVQRLRERVSGLAYGDQGLVVHRSLFDAVGGYPDLPLMEDVEIVRRIRRRADPDRLPADLVTSSRRYEREGRWRGWARNGILFVLYFMGVPPRALARWYRPEPAPESAVEPESDGGPPPHGDPRPDDDPQPNGDPRPDDDQNRHYDQNRCDDRERHDDHQPEVNTESDPAAEPGPPSARILLVFAKAPVEGRVKTRLARDLGHERATRLYRKLGRRVVDQLRGGPYRTVVCYDPPEAEPEVRSWLGSEDLEFRPQEGEELGDRMAEAFEWALGRVPEACIVGTDAPGVDRDVVEEAFHRLGAADVVLGPATDGGYYLMALSEPRTELFRDMEWSTAEVLDATVHRARRHGLRVELLDERTDLDTSEDLARLGLTGP